MNPLPKFMKMIYGGRAGELRSPLVLLGAPLVLLGRVSYLNSFLNSWFLFKLGEAVRVCVVLGILRNGSGVDGLCRRYECVEFQEFLRCRWSLQASRVCVVSGILRNGSGVDGLYRRHECWEFQEFLRCRWSLQTHHPSAENCSRIA
jgi:hypothetical protein